MQNGANIDSRKIEYFRRKKYIDVKNLGKCGSVGCIMALAIVLRNKIPKKSPKIRGDKRGIASG